MADVAAAASNVGPVSGVVVDPAGKPAAGAKVWLVSVDVYFFHAPQTLAEATTDEKGKFQLPAVKWKRSNPNAPPPMLAARDAQGRLGAAELDMSLYSRGTVPSATKITLWRARNSRAA